MADLLERMALGARQRVARARARESEPALRRRASDTPPPRKLALPRGGFELIAEIKRRSPSAGAAIAPDAAPVAWRAREYERAGAAAISVLTEPEEFAGSLDDLCEAASAVALPAMRKDFLVDPYQVFEARAAGAAGVLLLLRLLDDARLGEIAGAAAEAGMFALIEAFDAADLARASGFVAAADRRGLVLVGLNARDLASLRIDPNRFAALARQMPAGVARVAESGLASAADARRVAALGYDAALVGGALMRAADPGRLIREMIRAGREERTRSCAYE